MHPSDDHTLLRNYCANRSEDAFTQLVRRHLPLVFHAALRRLNSTALAEEAAQNAFARLAVKAAAVARHPERLRSWLHRTAFLEACTLARREARLSRLPLPPESTAMHRPEIYDRLDEALNALPELDRELIFRKYCAGEDYRHIAAEVGKSEAACQKRVERGLLRLSESLGGASAATVVVAALAGGTGTASAVPAAERIASAALEKSAGSSGAAAGAWSGFATAACIAAALGGGVVGWRQERQAPSASATVTAAAGQPDRSISPVTRSAVLPASQPFAGTLDEVLESIRAGRLGPLVDFLPRATPADLRAIVTEEDFSGLGEGSPPEKAAHSIAFRHWAEIDPAGAFVYATTLGRENMQRSARAFASWMEKDHSAAEAALSKLPLGNRRNIIASLNAAHDDLANAMVHRHPDLLWDLAIWRYWHGKQFPATDSSERDEKSIAAILAGEREPGSTDRQVIDVFMRLAFRNPSAALEQAANIPAPGLREVVLQALRSCFIPLLSAEKLEQLASTLPSGLDRTRATAALFKNLATTQPTEALRRLRSMPPGLERDAAFAQAGSVLAGSDPWALLETLVMLRGAQGSADRAIHADGADAGSDTQFWNDNPVGRALQFAIQDDAPRALKLIPAIQTRLVTDSRFSKIALGLANAWAATDLPAALNWVAENGSDTLLHDFRWKLSAQVAPKQVEELIPMLENTNDRKRQLLYSALGDTLVEAVFTDGGQNLLSRLRPADADAILGDQASNLSHDKNFDSALELAAAASPEARQTSILPRIAEVWLGRDTDGAVTWLNSQPAETRQMLIEYLKTRRLSDEARNALGQLTP